MKRENVLIKLFWRVDWNYKYSVLMLFFMTFIAFSQNPVAVYRFHLNNNPYQEHLYSTNANEVTSPWVNEGIAFYVSSSTFSSSVPVYRLRKDGVPRLRLLTSTDVEKNTAINAGYVLETTLGYIYPSNNTEGTLIYRTYKSSVGDRIYTEDNSEVSTLISAGYVQESNLGRSLSLPVPTGAVKVTLSPNEAITAGAQWNLDAGSWQSSGTTLSSVSIGAHTINFKPITSWTAPASQQALVAANQTTPVSVAYTLSAEYGSVTVTISPAISVASAKWQLDGTGSWYSSGYTLTNVLLGNHFVNYSTVLGWTSPVNYNFNLVANQSANISGAYTQIAVTSTLSITSPKGGENLTSSNNYTISGTVSSNITAVQLDFSINNGLTYTPIISTIPVNDVFQYVWVVSEIPTSNCTIRAIGSYVDASGISRFVTDVSKAFSITVNCFGVFQCSSNCYSDYPYTDAPNSACVLHGNDCSDGIDPWGFCKYNCTSWVAWCINKALADRTLTGSHAFSNSQIRDKDGVNHTTHLGDASNWKVALQPFFTSDAIPAVGSIAWWASGHVAYVNCVNGTSVTITEYNYKQACYYSTRTIGSATAGIPDSYIHVENGGKGGGDGTVITPISIATSNDINIHSHNNLITIEAGKSSGDIQIYSARGQRLFHQSIQQARTTINLQGFSKGIFIVAVKSGDTEIRKTEIK